MAKKNTPAPDDETPDLNSLLSGLKQAKAKTKKEDYEVLPGFEKEVDLYNRLAAEKDSVEALMASKKYLFVEEGVKYNKKNKTNKTIGFAGTGGDKVLFSPTNKYSGIPMRDEDNKESEIVKAIKKLLDAEKIPRWFKALQTISIDTDDPKQLAELIQHIVKGGFGEMLTMKEWFTPTAEYHNEKYSAGLKIETIDYIDSQMKPVNMVKSSKKKKGE